MQNVKKIIYFIVCIVSCRIYACDVVDDVGRHVVLNKPAERIISLAPDLTENLFAAGAGSHIIGVVAGSDYPEQAKKIPVVAAFDHIDVENFYRLNPDLVVVWKSGPMVTMLSHLPFTVYVANPKNLSDVAHTIRQFGCLAGADRKAELAAHQFEAKLSILRKRFQRQHPVSVFYQVWEHPLMTVTKDSWINDVIEICGGYNLFADLAGVAPIVSRESVIVADPDVIVGTEKNLKWQKMWTEVPVLRAARLNNLVTLQADTINRAGPRLLKSIQKLCNSISNN